MNGIDFCFLIETGPDLEQNPKLQSIIARAKAADMPKDKIEQSIKNATRV